MSDPKLRECPFCLGDNIVCRVNDNAGIPQWIFYCYDCGCDGPNHSDPAEAARRWNTRPSPWVPVEPGCEMPKDGQRCIIDRVAGPEFATFQHQRGQRVWVTDGRMYCYPDSVRAWQPFAPFRPSPGQQQEKETT